MILSKVNTYYVLVGRCFILELAYGDAVQLVADGKARYKTFEVHLEVHARTMVLCLVRYSLC